MKRIEDCISFLVGKTAQRVSHRTRAKLDPFGITPTQYAVLWVLWHGDDVSASEVAARLAIDGATTTGVIDRLEAAGLLERRPDLRDRRVLRLFLTPQGRELQEPLERAMNELNEETRGLLGTEAPAAWSALRTLGDVEDGA